MPGFCTPKSNESNPQKLEYGIQTHSMEYSPSSEVNSHPSTQGFCSLYCNPKIYYHIESKAFMATKFNKISEASSHIRWLNGEKTF